MGKIIKGVMVMKNIKKPVVLCVAVAILMTIALTACGDDNDKKDSLSKENPSQTDISSTYNLGTIDGNVWSSKYIGLKFTCNEDFSIDKSQTTKAEDNEESFPVTVLEFYAEKSDQTENVMLMTDRVGAEVKTEADYYKIFEKQIENAADVKYTFENGNDTKLGNDTYKCVNATAANGVKQRYLCRKISNRVVCIVFSAKDFSLIDNLMSCFSGN